VTYHWTDTWSDRIGCWADVYDVGYDVYRACEATPDPASHLGLCAKHEAQLRVPLGCVGRPGGESPRKGDWIATLRG
jgi:hypothetical protein